MRCDDPNVLLTRPNRSDVTIRIVMSDSTSCELNIRLMHSIRLRALPSPNHPKWIPAVSTNRMLRSHQEVLTHRPCHHPINSQETCSNCGPHGCSTSLRPAVSVLQLKDETQRRRGKVTHKSCIAFLLGQNLS